jgi:hypothetical protein
MGCTAFGGVRLTEIRVRAYSTKIRSLLSRRKSNRLGLGTCPPRVDCHGLLAELS